MQSCVKQSQEKGIIKIGAIREFCYLLTLIYSSLSLYISLSIQVHAYIFLSLSIIVIRPSNLVHTVSLITNYYFHLLNRKERENGSTNIQGITSRTIYSLLILWVRISFFFNSLGTISFSIDSLGTLFIFY